MNCWDFMNCGREAGGRNVAEKGICPAYPDGGKTCARVAGTLCKGEIQGTFAVKLMECLHCSYYRSEHYDRQYRSFTLTR